MLPLRILFIAFLSLFISNFSFSKEKVALKTESIKVNGNCDMCKKKIEKAARIKGVKYANWNMETKMLEVRYRPNKTDSDRIQKSVANAGYDTEKYRADDKVYDALHTCCKYER